jgi:YbgC/YbaW family acyl-CoA thioester hydrolase
MYPYLKLVSTILRAKRRPAMTLEETSVLKLRAGLSDIDPFMELNNARYFNYMEMGRWDYSYRTGFWQMMRKQKWGVAVGGSNIRFRRRIPFLSRFTLTSQLICHDGRWFYFLQETHRDNKICSSAVMKVCVTSKGGIIPIDNVLKLMGRSDWQPDFPDWVTAWQEAESQRPWPSD